MENTKQKIVIVEDDRHLGNALHFELQNAGFEVVVAENGREGLEKIKVEKPDLILLDLLLPMEDGFRILETIKTDNTFKATPVIILSNLSQESDIAKGKKLGAADYLIKSSFSIKEVVEKVREHIGKPQL